MKKLFVILTIFLSLSLVACSLNKPSGKAVEDKPKVAKAKEDSIETKESNSESKEKIAKAKDEILKYKESIKDIDYIEAMDTLEYLGLYTFVNDGGSFSIKELIGKTMYEFIVPAESSPSTYFYDEKTKDVFLMKQGQVFWINKGNLHVNAPKASDYNKETKPVK